MVERRKGNTVTVIKFSLEADHHPFKDDPTKDGEPAISRGCSKNSL